MISMRPFFLLLLVLVGIAAVACGSDDASPASESRGLVEPTLSGDPTAITARPPTPTSPAGSPTSTASPFDGIETHPLTRIAGNIPPRPEIRPTATPGGEYQFDQKLDAFPSAGIRPFMEIDWNVPLRVANEKQQALLNLVAQIPDTPENRRLLQLSDQALWAAQTGFNMPTIDDDKDAYQQELNGIFDRVGIDRAFADWPGTGPHLSGYTDYSSQLPTFSAMGFDQRNVDQSALANGNSPDFMEIIAGRYDPELSRRLLSECDCPQPHTVTSYGGFEYWSWGDGPIGQIELRHAEPVFDHLGRGGHILMTEDGLYRSLSVPLMEQLIDTLNGSQPSLADNEDFRLIADVMGASNAVGVRVVDGERLSADQMLLDGSGFLFETQRPDGSIANVTQESTRANALLAPPLLPYETLATARGSFGPRRFEVVVIAHANEETAVANALRLTDRLVNSNSDDGVPWAVKFPSAEISVSGKSLVARLYWGEFGGHSLGFGNNLLLMHE